MDQETYNGWKNHTTWAVKLHWDNNQADYEYFAEMAKQYKEGGKADYEFAQFLKDSYEEIFERVLEQGRRAGELSVNMVRDCGHADDCDWIEVARAYYQEADE